MKLTWGGPGNVLEVGEAVVPVLEAALEALLLLHHHYPGLHRVRRVQAGAAAQTKKLLEKRHLFLLIFLSRFFPDEVDIALPATKHSHYQVTLPDITLSSCPQMSGAKTLRKK